MSGYSVATLKMAKLVCATVKRLGRVNSLSFSHLKEIVTRAPAPQARDAGVSGYSVATLKQAKFVCSKVNRLHRSNSLSYSQLHEIATRAPEAEIQAWQERAVREQLTTAALREQLRLSAAGGGWRAEMLSALKRRPRLTLCA